MHGEQFDKRPNRLISEKSPYLQQHAYNPVDWYPWGQEAFKRAAEESKPVFLSIGYSTCHWCHMMEKESFEDEEVARLLNEAFVCIKVDREERPDLDGMYMKVCQIMTGSGGWPLSIVMTPDKKPFFATTYIPKENQFGRIGFKGLIPRIKALWDSCQSEFLATAEEITVALKQSEKESLSTAQVEALNKSTMDEAFESLCANFDDRNGGFGVAPKFPTAHNLTFLLRYWKRTAHQKALWMVEKTLSSMYRGGVFDHVGFGFHRYSTDSRWFVPHFEKMLYDQAMLTMAYTEAYQVTRKEEYAQVAHETIGYILREMTAPEGGFYSAEDADVEGEEGKFYLWTEEEMMQILNREEAELLTKIFDIQKCGNFVEEATQQKNGKNILHMQKPPIELASELKIHPEQIRARIESSRQKLFAARERRVHPGKDDKILVDWNGLMVAALAKAAQVFDEPRYVVAAKKAVDFIIERMLDFDRRLFHRYRSGEAAVHGFLDDYAFFIWGLLELYEASSEVKYLQLTITLTDTALRHFWEEEQGGFFFTADDAEDFLVRNKEAYDGAYPSGNSVMLLNMLRLARMTAKAHFEEKATRMLRSFSAIISRMPAAHTQFLSALDFAIGPSHEVVIVGNPQAKDTMSMLNALRKEFVPNKVVLFRPINVEHPEITCLAEFTREMFSPKGVATAYVCRNHACNLPTTDVEKMLKLLNT
jgi:uncharacterized protein YyaL (SSP411 family)